MLKYIVICKIIYIKSIIIVTTIYLYNLYILIFYINNIYFFNKIKINFMIDQTGKFFCIGTMHKFSNYLLLNFSL